MVTGRGEVRDTHLIIAAQICATDNVLTDYRMPLWRRATHRVQDELEKFDTYLENCESGPDLYDKPATSTGKLKAPWQQVIVTTLIRHTSIRRDEAWRMPVGQALWEFHSLQEQLSGASSIYGEDDREIESDMLSEDPAVIEDRIAAFDEREERIKRGTWPRDEDGRPLPFSHENLRPL